ncbi:MAG: isochorismate synthase [Candidatus Hydrogenedentes bacterium]|nr:isochorismate synthase [Candidatus Hydrogenedentota bacterium]
MHDPLPPSAPFSPATALQRVAAHAGETLAAGTGASSAELLWRIEAPIEPLEPIEWLRAQSGFTQYYWSDRNDTFTMAGVGEADVLAPDGPVNLQQVFARMRKRLPERFPSLRYYGGLRFTPTAGKESRWREFKAYRFIVPRFEVVRRARGTVFACNLFVKSDAEANRNQRDQILADLARLSFAPAPETPFPRVLGRQDLPDQARWRAMVERALEALSRHDFEKVVLARETCFTLDAPLDPVALLVQLQQQTPHSFEFCFHPVADRAFIGASPERLFKRVNVHLQSEALAGTRPRGRTDAEDERLARELLGSDKELHEHRLVLQTLRAHFQRFCVEFQEDEEPGLMHLRHCRHLYTRIEGILKKANVDAALLEAFHPTPAVGGTPRDHALAWIQHEEPFDRGIYAGPVGWVGFDACEFCVAIRSGLVKDNVLAVYNGAGIVTGSLPQEEWAEIEAKMGSFLDVLGMHRA